MLQRVIEIQFLNNSLLNWLAALVMLVLGTLVLYLAKLSAQKLLQGRAAHSASRPLSLALDMLRRTKFAVLLVEALWLAGLLLTMPAKARGLLDSLALIAAFIQVGLWASVLAVSTIGALLLRDNRDASSATGLSIISFIARLLVWSAVSLLILDNLGMNITTLVAGLGVGGIAIGLAVQNILGDLFASFSIILDKPFEIGDFIIVDELMGTVERIGLKTTRVRSLSGEQLVFSNSDLLKSRIRNYKRMAERRVVFNFGVLYGTPPEKLERIPVVVRGIIESIEKTRFDRAHFNAFGASSLDFEVAYYVLDRDYNLYMDVQQHINLALLKAFHNEGIEFAFPTRTIVLERTPER